MAHVLLIEDDQAIRSALVNLLVDRGHEVQAESNGMAGVETAVAGGPDVVVLDLGLPDIEGADALRMIRAVTDVPVIVATARDDEREIVRVLDAGADDYVTKPYTAEQLEARIRAVLRRSSGTDEPSLVVAGTLRIDLDGQEAALDGKDLELTKKEFDLLSYLAQQPGVMVSKRKIMAEVWGQPYGGADKTVDVHLSWLRKKLGETAAEPRFIHTRRGVGVKFVAPEA